MLRPSSTFGDYTIFEVLGRSKSTVYRVRNTKMGRDEALKVLGDHDSQDPYMVSRFNDDARLAAKVVHPHVVTVFEVGEIDGIPYFTMEYLRGESLDKRLAGKNFPTYDESSRILRQTASALDAAHAVGVVHRDVKPANIMVMGEGEQISVKVIDFDIARDNERLTRRTADGAILGTLDYISPEGALGTNAGNSADQYSLAVVAYQLLCGRLPFEGRYGVAAANAHAHESPPDPTRYGVKRSASLALLRALAKSPADRYPSCTKFVDALLESKPERTPAPIKGSSVFVGLTALAGVVCLAVGLARQPHGDDDPTPIFGSSTTGTTGGIGGSPIGTSTSGATPGSSSGVPSKSSTGSDEGAASTRIETTAGDADRNETTVANGSDDPVGNGSSETDGTSEAPSPPPPAKEPVSGFDASFAKVLNGQYLDSSDVNKLSKAELFTLRNTIFAKRHYIFHGTKNSDRLNSYFKNFSWYQGITKNMDGISAQIANDPVDAANLKLIKRYETG